MENIALVVVEPFLQYKRGDMIEDPATVEQILASEQHNHVIKTAAPAKPAAAVQD
jgi:hypothetical protein